MITDLSYLKEFSDNDTEFMKEMIEMFIQRFEEDMPIIKQDLAGGNLSAVSAKIHKIKPSITFMGINSLVKDIQQAENLAKDGKAGDELNQLVAKMDEIFTEAIVELKAAIDSF